MENISAAKQTQNTSKAIANQSNTTRGKSMPAVPVLQEKSQLTAEELPEQKEFAPKQNAYKMQSPPSVQQHKADLQPFTANKTLQKKDDDGALSAPTRFVPIQKKENKTGLPDNLKSGIENLSGVDISDVKVHYNSAKPAQLHAHAYAQGSDIHIASGQERHLPHEAWHVVQQKQGRVKPTLQMKGGINVNEDMGLEQEADIMGAKALGFSEPVNVDSKNGDSHSSSGVVQHKVLQKKSLAELIEESPLEAQVLAFEEREREEKETAQLKKDDGSIQAKTIQRKRVSDGAILGSINSSVYPESVQHITDAINSGQPSRVTINRPTASSNRRKSLRGIPTISGTDRDEYPMAVMSEGGTGASVRHIDPSDNRGAGSSIGHIFRQGAPDGTTVDVLVLPQMDGSTTIQL
ncbi:DUF4157 domain-containing protein [Mucilaginibacter sp. PPCGB 2223]|uniref:eCIS core domain-containing protein n=1 Tax=Mucilaginibacter sp. PPCGB 2223 TaxID=1886027 RepID=UPI000B125A9B|nr:NucA/NucB deoxyribonuclease domain-containing protein [Mucilaginibacter sp. PPCGB 2223]